jgi:iron complex outermembrane receptor protein
MRSSETADFSIYRINICIRSTNKSILPPRFLCTGRVDLYKQLNIAGHVKRPGGGKMASSKKAKKIFARTGIAFAVANALSFQAASAQDSDVMDEVIVTATKRAVNIQDVAVSVTSVTGDMLLQKQVTDILSLEKAVPGLTVASYGNNPQAIIRGAGTAGTSDIAVPIYQNGMYLPTYGQALAGYIDIDRIETLRGPQGTLFGRNTYGGLINVITKKPDVDGFDVGVAFSAGDYSLQKLEGFVNIPMGDKVALRVSAADETRDPYVNNIYNPAAGLKDSDYSYVRAQLLIAPSDTFSINLTASYWKDTANGNLNWAYKAAGIPLDPNDVSLIDASSGVLDPRMGLYSGANCTDSDRAGGRSQAGNVCDGDTSASIVDGTHTVDLNRQSLRELEETAFYADVNWELSNHNVSLKAAAFDYSMVQFSDADYSSMDSWWDGNYSNNKSHQADLMISSTSDGPLQYTGGLYLFDNQDDANTSAYMLASFAVDWSAYAGATPETPAWAYWASEGRGGTKSTAAYGQAEYSFTDRLHATVGLRYTKDDRRSQSSNGLPWQTTTDSVIPPSHLFTYEGREDAISTGNDSNTDYRLGLAFDATDDVMIYGSFATAYIAGSTDTVTQTLLDPQTNETFELGIKSIILGGAMTLNASAYSAKYDGLTTTQFISQGAGGVAVAVQVPGGSIESSGIELEGYWYPSENLTIDFGVTFEDSKYDEFSVGAKNLVWNGQNPEGAVEIDGQSWFIMDGKDAAYSPDMTLGVGVAYNIEMGNLGTLTPYVNAYYNSGYFSNRAPVFFGKQESYTKVDFSLGWQSESGTYTAKLWVNNASDELIQTYTEILSRARVAYDYQPLRTWGVRFGYNF